MNEEMAIMSDVHVGMRDCASPVCWFSVETLNNGGSLQVISINEMVKLIEDARVYELEDLEGKPCAVEVKGNRILFKGVKK